MTTREAPGPPCRAGNIDGLKKSCGRSSLGIPVSQYCQHPRHFNVMSTRKTNGPSAIHAGKQMISHIRLVMQPSLGSKGPTFYSAEKNGSYGGAPCRELLYNIQATPILSGSLRRVRRCVRKIRFLGIVYMGMPQVTRIEIVDVH